MRAALIKLFILCGCLMLVTAAGCAKTKPVLYIYTWADYIKPELVLRFEQLHNCQIVIDTFDSNEVMYAKIKAGAQGYDLITPSSYMVTLMSAQGMLQKLNHGMLTNLRHIDPEYLTIALDPRMEHSVPYMLTTTVIACLKSAVSDFTPSWTMFEKKTLKGRMTMLNDMRETIGAALKSLGYSLNTTSDRELEAAYEVLIRWKANLAKFENEQYKTGLASGEFVLVHGYSGDIMQVREENDDIAYAVPREGTSIACDDLVIPRDARNVKLAHQFINFMHEPVVAAENTAFIKYLCPNSESYKILGSEILDDPAIFIPPDIRAKCEVIRDLGADNKKYTALWDRIKAH